MTLSQVFNIDPATLPPHVQQATIECRDRWMKLDAKYRFSCKGNLPATFTQGAVAVQPKFANSVDDAEPMQRPTSDAHSTSTSLSMSSCGYEASMGKAIASASNTYEAAAPTAKRAVTTTGQPLKPIPEHKQASPTANAFANLQCDENAGNAAGNAGHHTTMDLDITNINNDFGGNPALSPSINPSPMAMSPDADDGRYVADALPGAGKVNAHGSPLPRAHLSEQELQVDSASKYRQRHAGNANATDAAATPRTALLSAIDGVAGQQLESASAEQRTGLLKKLSNLMGFLKRA